MLFHFPQSACFTLSGHCRQMTRPRISRVCKWVPGKVLAGAANGSWHLHRAAKRPPSSLACLSSTPLRSAPLHALSLCPSLPWLSQWPRCPVSTGALVSNGRLPGLENNPRIPQGCFHKGCFRDPSSSLPPPLSPHASNRPRAVAAVGQRVNKHRPEVWKEN